jgi:hypothetical protein
MRLFHSSPSAREDAEWPLHGGALCITSEEIARAARALVAAYGPAASQLMVKRTRAVRRRGDSESATLWSAVAKAIEEQLGTPTADGNSALGD